MTYRNNWVHGQPPTVKGLGLVWKRGNRWQTIDYNGHTEQRLYGGTGGDPAEYSVDDLIGFMQPALGMFVRTLNEVLNEYLVLLKSAGINITDKGLGMTWALMTDDSPDAQ
jgi:hypothetical protein